MPLTAHLCSTDSSFKRPSLSHSKLRAQLGLKPLEGSTGPDGEVTEEKKSFVHAPAKNLREERRQEHQREKVAVVREKRRVQERLRAVRGLGEDSSGDEEAAKWVERNRKAQTAKQEAEKRVRSEERAFFLSSQALKSTLPRLQAKLFEDMDAEFGVSELVESEIGPSRGDKGYDSTALAGLTVEHSLARFKEGQTVILTLKDRAILEDEKEEAQGALGPSGDVLVNVNFQVSMRNHPTL